MRISRLAPLAALAALATGCAPTPPPLVLPPSPAESPLFASEDEALAAAVEVYGAYVEASDEVGQGGWQEISRYSSVAVGDLLESDISTGNEFKAKGLAQTGSTSFVVVGLQQYTTEPSVVISFYLCLNVSDVDIQDSNGHSIVPTDRDDILPVEATVIGDSSTGFKVSQSDLWSGADFC